MRNIYERILAAGGAEVEDWATIQRLNAEFMPNGVKLTITCSIKSFKGSTERGGLSFARFRR